MTRLKSLLLIILIAGAILSMGFALAQTGTAPDGAHTHPGYETRIAALEGTVAALSQTSPSAPTVSSTLTPSPTAAASNTATATSTPSSTATSRTPRTPTQEEPDGPTATGLTDIPPTFTPAQSSTPTRTHTPLPTAAVSATPDGDCAIWADFVPSENIKRRAGPSLSATILSPLVTAGRIEVVCYETLRESEGLRWIRVSADRVEWFAVGQVTAEGFEWWGEITLWR